MILQSQTQARWLVALVASILLVEFVPTPARAAGGANCAILVTPLVFGRYVPFSNSASDFTATITLHCSSSGTAAVPINGTIALIGSGGRSGRKLTSGTHQLRYQLYRDPGRTALWGDGGGAGGAAPVSGVVNATVPFQQTLTIYGRILARQSGAFVGSYSDQITAILNY